MNRVTHRAARGYDLLEPSGRVLVTR